MNTQLKTAIDLIPLIHSLTYGEASVAVTDRTTYLADVPGKRIDFKVKPGDPLKQGGAVYEVIETGQLIRREQSAAFFGVPYIIIAAPIKSEEQTTVGTLVVRLPLYLEEELAKMAGELAAAMTQFSGAFREIATIAENTASAADLLGNATASMNDAITETVAVTASIAKVTDKTRLLGLNALIESAHAGSAGAGFGVVAREIQMLAGRSLKATQDMNQSLDAVSAQNQAVTAETQSLQEGAGILNSRVAQSLAIVENLTGMAQKLKKLAARSDSNG